MNKTIITPIAAEYPIEKLNLWDRLFNRYRKVVHSRGSEIWHKSYYGQKIAGSDYTKFYNEYIVIDRLTGSFDIVKYYD